MSNKEGLEMDSDSRSLDEWVEDLLARFNEVVYDVLTEINKVFDEVF